jgi:hypothetical protein
MSMRMMRAVVAVALLAGALAVRPLGAGENQTWTGSLVDASCYLTDNTQTGDEHMGMKQCGMACLKMGRPAGILTSDKKFFVLIAPSPDVAEYVGQPIRITGKLRSGSILVDKFEVKKSGAWVAVKLNAMM